ncbi:MAG: hypothetical protein RIS35_851 [Pseudomonadota bacterium]|jgi:probable phosphoglycerate mutase
MTELILVRHGVTAWNKARRFQGQIDIPLDEEGHQQARLAAQRLAREPIDAVYASDLGRAWQTGEAIATALALRPRSEPGLRERSYGSFEGRTFDEIQRELPDEYARWQARDPVFCPGGIGESLEQLHARVSAALEAIVRSHPAGRVVAVTHGGVLDCAYRIATGLPMRAPRGHDLLNASLNRIAWDGQVFRLVVWADVDHLTGAIDDVDARV